MTETFGWTGNILWVDLTTRSWTVESSETYCSRFVGGIGVGLAIAWEEISDTLQAFEPENPMIFAPGPLTGTLVPGSGRFEIVSKSPKTYPREAVTRSGMGGYWGPELKFAGYDALVVKGASERWVHLWIKDERVEFLDAADCVGKDTYETQIHLKKNIDPLAHVLCIGPAGESLCRISSIISETCFASGRSGFGAVMGSKKLKSIAVRGTKPLRIHDPARVIEVSRDARRYAAGNPMREWTTNALSQHDREQFINLYRTKNTGCFGCPIQCFAFIDIPGIGRSGAHCINYFYHGPATSYYGAGQERDQAVAEGFVLANRLGLDTYEFRWMIDLLEALQTNGSLPPAPELPLDKIGSREFINSLMLTVAHRRGIGDLLAEGCARAADRIDQGWAFAAEYFPAHGAAQHAPNQIRNYPGVALGFALDSRDPFIDQHSYLRLAVTDLWKPEPYTLTPDMARAIARKVYGNEKAVDHSTFEFKPEALIYTQNRSAVVNLLVVCDWIYPILSNTAIGLLKPQTSLESDFLSAVTGVPFSEEDLDLIGERVWNLSRAMMVKEHRMRVHDTLHESYFRATGDKPAVPRESFEQAKARYYALRGWDSTYGWPTRRKMRKIGLSDIADILLDYKVALS